MIVIKNRRLTIILTVVILLLLIPMIAMVFTKEVSWGLFDFIVAGALLIGTGLIIELILQKVKTKGFKIFMVCAAIAILLIVWVELAVGIFR